MVVVNQFRHIFLAFLYAVLWCQCVGCQPDVENQPDAVFYDSVELEMVYHEESVLPGKDCENISGKQVFVFRNIDRQRSLMLRFPPLAIYSECQKNGFRRLGESEWPEFAKKSFSWKLLPNSQRSVESPYNLLIPTVEGRRRVGTGAPRLCFVFGKPGDVTDHSQGTTFTGCVLGNARLLTGEGANSGDGKGDCAKKFGKGGQGGD
jgi:hypothetical protein